MNHTDAIEWPNGKGFTPCTPEFADITDRINAISDHGRISMDDMSPADYQTYNRLLHDRDGLQLAGHVGKSHRY